MTPFRAAMFLNPLTGIALFFRKGLIAGVCPLKMYGLFAVIYLGAVFTSSAEIRAQAAGGDYRASTTTGHTTTGPGSQQEVLFYFFFKHHNHVLSSNYRTALKLNHVVVMGQSADDSRIELGLVTEGQWSRETLSTPPPTLNKVCSSLGGASRD